MRERGENVGDCENACGRADNGENRGDTEKYHDIIVKSLKISPFPIAFDIVISYNNGKEISVRVLKTAAERVREGDLLSRGGFAELLFAAKVYSAAADGIRLLGYADNSVSAISRKLRERGYARDVAFEAAKQLAALGIIDEERQIATLGRSLAERKQIGLRRVEAELAAKGYDRSAINEWARNEKRADGENGGDGITFPELCARVRAKRGGLPGVDDAEGRRSLLSYLYRRGFSADDIRLAAAIAAEAEGVDDINADDDDDDNDNENDGGDD